MLFSGDPRSRAEGIGSTGASLLVVRATHETEDETEDGQQATTTRIGSGFIVQTQNDRPRILTAASLVKGALKVEVRYGTKILPARVLRIEGRDPYGMAVLETETRAPGQSLPLYTGSLAAGAKISVARIANGKHRILRGTISGFDGKSLGLSLALDESMLGAPVFDPRDRVVGMITKKSGRYGSATRASILSATLAGWGVHPPQLASPLFPENSARLYRDESFAGNGSVLIQKDGGLIQVTRAPPFGNTGTAPGNRIRALDSSGKQLWSVSPGGPHDRICCVRKARAGYLALGTKVRDRQRDLWIVRLSGTGKILGERVFGQQDLDESSVELIGLADGNFYAAANVGKGLGMGAWYIKLDARGNEIWSVGATEQNTVLRVRGLALAPDGGLISAGESLKAWQSGTSAWLMRLSPAGKIVWQKKSQMQGRPTRVHFLRAGQKSYIFGGSIQFEDQGRAGFIGRIKADGSNPSAHIWSGEPAAFTELHDALESDGGEIVALGSTAKPANGPRDILLLRLDRSMQRPRWRRTFGDRDFDSGYHLRALKNGFIIAGDTVATQRRAFLLRLNAAGKPAGKFTAGADS